MQGERCVKRDLRFRARNSSDVCASLYTNRPNSTRLRGPLMGRFTLSMIFLMLVGGTGFALPDWINIYDLYGSPSSGSLAPTAAGIDIGNGSRVFRPVPDGGFGSSTTSFQNRDSFSSVNQPHNTLQFRGVVLPNGTNNYFYKIPSSGSVDLTLTDNESDSSPAFRPMPDGGFGPSTASFQSRDSFSSVNQTHAALQLKDRWLFDFLPGGHPRHPHHVSRRRHLFNDQ
jgi:hypothetical protein